MKLGFGMKTLQNVMGCTYICRENPVVWKQKKKFISLLLRQTGHGTAQGLHLFLNSRIIILITTMIIATATMISATAVMIPKISPTIASVESPPVPAWKRDRKRPSIDCFMLKKNSMTLTPFFS